MGTSPAGLDELVNMTTIGDAPKQNADIFAAQIEGTLDIGVCGEHVDLSGRGHNQQIHPQSAATEDQGGMPLRAHSPQVRRIDAFSETGRCPGVRLCYGVMFPLCPVGTGLPGRRVGGEGGGI